MSDSAGTGRGLAFITAAKLYFILSGFVVQVGLPRLLGSPEAFGQYSLAMSIVSVVNNVLIAATVQSVSKRVSEDESAGRRTPAPGPAAAARRGRHAGRRPVLRLRPGWHASPTTPSSSCCCEIAAFVPLCYALYATLVGSLNGRRMFQHQAALDITFSTVRTRRHRGRGGAGLWRGGRARRASRLRRSDHH